MTPQMIQLILFLVDSGIDLAVTLFQVADMTDDEVNALLPDIKARRKEQMKRLEAH